MGVHLTANNNQLMFLSQSLVSIVSKALGFLAGVALLSLIFVTSDPDTNAPIFVVDNVSDPDESHQGRQGSRTSLKST